MKVAPCLGLRRGTPVWDGGRQWGIWAEGLGQESAAVYLPTQGVAQGLNGIAFLLIQIVFNWTLAGAGLG